MKAANFLTLGPLMSIDHDFDCVELISRLARPAKLKSAAPITHAGDERVVRHHRRGR